MSQIETNPDLTAAALGFAVRVDDFSVQVSRPDDPRFWIRVETGGDAALVSDIALGTQDVHAAARALVMALSSAGFPRGGDLRFSDIAPGAAPVDARADELRRVLAAYGRATGQFLAGFRLEARGDKTDVLASFT